MVKRSKSGLQGKSRKKNRGSRSRSENKQVPDKRTKEQDNQNNANQNEFDNQIISASDIERYGYCPMSWWLKYKGLKVSDEKLERGTQDHREIIKKVSSVKEKEKFSKTSEFNIKLFAFVAIMLALNAVAILLPYLFVRNLLIYIAIIWIILAVTYFIYHLFHEKYATNKLFFQSIQSNIKDKTAPEGSKTNSKEKYTPITTSQTWKQSATWFLIIAGGLAFNGIALLQPEDPEIMSRIFMISALLWLIGTSVILYFVLRFEESQRSKIEEKTVAQKSKRKLSVSEKLVIGFAVVATLIAVNGLTIQHRDLFPGFTMLGQIILVLSALWLGISFIFLYISFRGGLVTRTFARDLKLADTELKKYKLVIETIKSPTISDRIFSYNWPYLFAAVAVILAINSITIRYGIVLMSRQSDIFSRFLVVIALLWLIGAFIFLYDALKNTQLAKEIRRLHGIYQGKIEYTDKMDDKTKMLFSKKHNIRGKPDYIVKIKGKYVPVEIKTGKVPRGPHFSHIIQIAAYCMLIQENYHTRPPYGIISYGKQNKHKIMYDSKLEELLLEKMVDMRNCIQSDTAHRNHHRAGKCRFCSRRDGCPERLA